MSELLNAIAKADLSRVQELIQRGADPNERDADGWFPLLMAAVAGPYELVVLLLAAAASVNARGADGTTPLMKATLWRRVEIVQLLLANGADPHIRDERGWTAADIAAHLGDQELGTLLERHG